MQLYLHVSCIIPSHAIEWETLSKESNYSKVQRLESRSKWRNVVRYIMRSWEILSTKLLSTKFFTRMTGSSYLWSEDEWKCLCCLLIIPNINPDGGYIIININTRNLVRLRKDVGNGRNRDCTEKGNCIWTGNMIFWVKTLHSIFPQI